MAFIKYISNRPETKMVTGGQVYDNMLLQAIKDLPSASIDYVHLNPSKNTLSKIISPIKYIFSVTSSHKSDVVIFNSSTFMWFMPLMFVLSKMLKRTTMVIHHHFMYMQLSGVKRSIYKRLEWLFLKNATRVIIPSPYIYDELKKKISEDRLLLLRIPFETTTKSAPNPIPGNLTYIGTIEERKGLIYLLEALNILKKRHVNHKLTIIGKVTEKPYYDNMIKFINDNELDVVFTGFISKDEKERILSQTDVFVFPSLLEGFGMVLIEAQAYGLPIVCFDNSAMPFSVKNNKNGYTVSTKDSLKFADAIDKIVSDRTLRNRFAIEARNNALIQPSIKDFTDCVTKYFDRPF